jgi:hypothetical protein
MKTMPNPQKTPRGLAPRPWVAFAREWREAELAVRLGREASEAAAAGGKSAREALRRGPLARGLRAFGAIFRPAAAAAKAPGEAWREHFRVREAANEANPSLAFAIAWKTSAAIEGAMMAAFTWLSSFKRQRAIVLGLLAALWIGLILGFSCSENNVSGGFVWAYKDDGGAWKIALDDRDAPRKKPGSAGGSHGVPPNAAGGNASADAGVSATAQAQSASISATLNSSNSSDASGASSSLGASVVNDPQAREACLRAGRCAVFSPSRTQNMLWAAAGIAPAPLLHQGAWSESDQKEVDALRAGLVSRSAGDMARLIGFNALALSLVALVYFGPFLLVWRAWADALLSKDAVERAARAKTARGVSVFALAVFVLAAGGLAASIGGMGPWPGLGATPNMRIAPRTPEDYEALASGRASPASVGWTFSAGPSLIDGETDKLDRAATVAPDLWRPDSSATKAQREEREAQWAECKRSGWCASVAIGRDGASRAQMLAWAGGLQKTGERSAQREAAEAYGLAHGGPAAAKAIERQWERDEGVRLMLLASFACAMVVGMTMMWERALGKEAASGRRRVELWRHWAQAGRVVARARAEREELLDASEGALLARQKRQGQERTAAAEERADGAEIGAQTPAEPALARRPLTRRL